MEKIKILIIEDEIITATDLKEILQKRGHRITGIAKNYYETASMIEYEKPDLALVDIKLRNSTHNGIEIAETLLKNKDIPYIFLTSQSDMATFDQAKQTAPKAYLTKPFRENEVVFQIELVFEQFLSQLQKNSNPAISDTIYVFVVNAHFRIIKKDIVAIEADSSYVKLILNGYEKPLLITMNLKKMASYLTSPNFFRLSRKHLINLDYLQKFDNDKIWMQGHENTIPIPQNGKKELMNQLAVVKIV
jgi:DNA-binding LytR/AlgR family response regulator